MLLIWESLELHRHGLWSLSLKRDGLVDSGLGAVGSADCYQESCVQRPPQQDEHQTAASAPKSTFLQIRCLQAPQVIEMAWLKKNMKLIVFYFLLWCFQWCISLKQQRMLGFAQTNSIGQYNNFGRFLLLAAQKRLRPFNLSSPVLSIYTSIWRISDRIIFSQILTSKQMY